MINEVFYSIQGEGLLIGTPALFIRFQGCNLRCIWCDEKQALDFDKKAKPFEAYLENIEDIISTYNPNLVVLTGGEPTLNDEFLKVFNFFKSLDKIIQIETNATKLDENIYRALKEYPKTYITLSPKYLTDYFIDPKFLDFNNIELKIVVDENLSKDILERDYIKPFIDKNVLILQPLSSNNGIKFLDKAMQLAKEVKARIIPQTHKLLGLK